MMSNQAEQQKSLLLVSFIAEKSTWKEGQERGLYME